MSLLRYLQISVFYFLVLNSSCRNSSNSKQVLFEVHEANTTGLDFNNKLTPTENFNMFSYMYFYNGSGLAAGDFNNDGKIDLFFASNQGEDKIYLNEGNLHFRDITSESKIPQDHGWSTGVSVVDINNDGLLDIYICKVGKFGPLNSKNQLLICKGIKNGIPFYEDEAKAYGLDFSGFSTQAVFFDYDMDGDLDMFLVNHTVHQNGSFAPRKNFLGTYDALSGDRLFRNDGNHFTNVTKESHINSSSISYGLGIAVADINLDGWPDLYIGNDFHENDYLYINKKNGTFEDQNEKRLMHTSKYTMGVDIADVTNDGYPEIISMDMLSGDPGVTMRSLGDDDFDVFTDKIASGYNYQYSRNNLQYNRRNGMFSEAGIYAGVHATDWSWSPLWMDFDNDGLKDLFISNGIPKRLNDIDYIDFISGSEMQQSIDGINPKNINLSLIDKFPEIKIPNKFYKNMGNLNFQDVGKSISSNLPTFSNGAIYADLDNDGDLDIVVNNINGSALLYENKSITNKRPNSVDLNLHGPDKNINAIGSKVVLFSNKEIRTYEKFAARGFMSSMEIPLHIGLEKTRVDSTFLIWPDNSYQKIQLQLSNKKTAFYYKKGLPRFDYDKITRFNKFHSSPVKDITKETGINYLHKENKFNEFDREPLMAHMISTEGPALAVSDINHDGLEDIFIGSSKTYHNAIFLQQKNGHFIQKIQPEMLLDSMFEDVDAIWEDVNHDGNKDLIIVPGGNEFYGMDEHMLPRVYLNDRKGNFRKLPNAFNSEFMNSSCIVSNDFNNDGFPDLFIGARNVPGNYGETPKSYLLQNDGLGHFKDVTEKYARGLAHIGMVTGAVWADMDNDGDKDLIVSCEWGGITAFINDHGHFTKKELTKNINGWWNFILPIDINGDGKLDLIAGNLGLNSRFQASSLEPVRMYINDFNGAGQKEQILTYYLQGKEIPFLSKAELENHFPALKKKFLYAEDYSKASLQDMFGENLDDAKVLSANYFSNSVLINKGDWDFKIKALPWEAQLSPYRSAASINSTKENETQIMLTGNYYKNLIRTGRNDADFGTILFSDKKSHMFTEELNGLVVKGEVRHMASIKINQKVAYVIARNDDSLMVIQFQDLSIKQKKNSIKILK